MKIESPDKINNFTYQCFLCRQIIETDKPIQPPDLTQDLYFEGKKVEDRSKFMSIPNMICDPCYKKQLESQGLK